LSEQEEQEKAAQQQLLKIQTKSAELTGAIDENQNQIMEILNNRTATKVKKQRYDSMLEQIQVRRSEMHQKLIAVESEASEHDELIAKFEAELQEIAQTISGYVTENKTYEEKIAALQQTIAKKNEQLRIGQTAFHREQSRLESLKNITERYDGYGNSIRKVMEKKEQEKGLLGVVADLIKVDKAYEIAVETALGGSIQNIVTDNEETAKRMITFLKQNKFGRATFLPLTSINGTAGIRQNEALQEEGVIGLANTLVKVEEIYRGLADHLLGRTVVVKHIDHGVALAKKYKQTLRIVTLEGELINPGGAMTGGAFRNSSNLLSRRREIEEFEKTVEKLKSEMEQMEQEVEHEKEVRADYYSKIEVIKQQLQKAYVIQNTAKMNAEQVKAKKADAKAVSSKIHEEGAELERQIKEIRENHASIQVELETSEKLEQELTEQIASYQKELDQERERESKQLLESEKVHLAYAAMEQKYQFLLENEQRIQEEITKFNEELSALRANKGDASEEIRKKETQIEDIRLTIANSKELFEEIQKEIASYSSQKEELTKKHKAFLAEREALSKHMSDLDKEAFRLNSQKEAFEQASEKQINYMWEEYELTYNMALKIKDENLTDLTFIKKQIQALKNEIRLLGNVNVNAIEDFKEVSERYAFLKNQHDDLIEAEATLKQIIEELDAAMRKQFRERFAEICVEFDKVFKQLFGGGKGTLELQEEEDILEAGIRIIAQPPGKKLQNMMQLSGGEKALTAISLLFAIQNLKPSPFCLLDEIEAALDDSNVDRYARYLHKLTKNTQFIVITHRRGTMTAADRLYGITMQEKGVSTLVSVDLLDKELTN
ncbi:MAG: chromosome segregation protein SMC, partial [Faecalimonas sp.]|nr:chromosome segregation protein SMC [Faecalimonas sp.]